MLAALDAINAEAEVLGKHPFFYKCNGENAAVLRAKKWSVIHMSDDAVVFPQTFTLEQPNLRNLQRKLGAAQKSGMVIKIDKACPWSDMQRIDHKWQNAHGKARGGTMGRFEIGYHSNHFIARGLT